MYGLGVVAYECLAGRRPFDAGSPVATAVAHLHEPVPDLPAKVPTALAGVVLRSLSKDPNQRYADGSTLAAALRSATPGAAAAAGGDGQATQVLAATPPVAAPVTQVLPVVPPAPTPAPVPVPAPAPAPAASRSRAAWVAALLVGLLVAVVVVLVLLLTLGGGDDSPGDVATGNASNTAVSTPPQTPSETSSPAVQTFDLSESDYVARNVDEVISELEDRGLDVDPQLIDNPGDRPADTVAGVSPTRGLSAGDTVTVTYYAAASSSPSPTPTTPSVTPSTSTPSPSETPTPASPSVTPSATPSVAPSATPGAPPPAPPPAPRWPRERDAGHPDRRPLPAQRAAGSRRDGRGPAGHRHPPGPDRGG